MKRLPQYSEQVSIRILSMILFICIAIFFILALSGQNEVEALFTILSLVIGAIIGVLTSYYFYKKSELFENDLRVYMYSQEEIFIRTRYPELLVWDYLENAPSDPDIPHLQEVRCKTKKVQRGSTLDLFFRVIDEGRNLSLPRGIQIRNELTGEDIQVRFESYGWLASSVPIPATASTGEKSLFFNLIDSAGNDYTQAFSYIIVE